MFVLFHFYTTQAWCGLRTDGLGGQSEVLGVVLLAVDGVDDVMRPERLQPIVALRACLVNANAEFDR